MTRILSTPGLLSAAALAVSLIAREGRAETVVQVPLPGLLDARSVTTLTGGQLVPWTLPTDGGNLQNAYMTKAGAIMQGQPPANALPDDGHFPANLRHPEVVLNFSNAADPTSPQTHLVPPSGSFSFAMPAATYSKVFLFFNGAAGGTTIMVTLNYTDGMETKSATIPDYYSVGDIPANDPVIFNLATNLSKWTKTHTVNEAGNHNITGVELPAMATKTLTGISVTRAANGNLVFWGATGVATSDLPVGGAGGAGGAGGGAGGAGLGGAGGASGGVPSGGIGGASSVGGAAGGPSGGATGVAGNGLALAGSGGAPITPSAGAATVPSDPMGEPACGCRLGAAGSPGSSWVWLWLVLGAAGASRLRKRRTVRRFAS